MSALTADHLVTQFQALAAELPKHLTENDELRRLAALKAAKKAVRQLQTPLEFFYAQTWSPLELPGAAIAIQLKLPNIIAEKDGPMTLPEIQKKANGDALLVYRIVRFMAAHAMIDQIDETTYQANAITRDYINEVRQASVLKMLFCAPSYMALPHLLRDSGFANSTDPDHCAWQRGLHTPDNFWQWLQKHPDEDRYFNTYMQQARTRFHEPLADVYPFEKLFETAGPDEVVFVDVGGGYGQQCSNLRQSFPRQQGRIVLQDLPHVVAGVAIEGVEAQAHDMFDEQPVKGARSYYFRGICHDHSDEFCRRFLSQIQKAMSEQSVLLIHERLVADVNPSELITKSDLMMMAQFAAQERSPRQMRELLESIGFKVTSEYSSKTNEWKITEATI